MFLAMSPRMSPTTPQLEPRCLQHVSTLSQHSQKTLNMEPIWANMMPRCPKTESQISPQTLKHNQPWFNVCQYLVHLTEVHQI